MKDHWDSGVPYLFSSFFQKLDMQVIYNLWDWMLWMCPVEGVQQDGSLASALLHTTNFLNKVFKVAPCELQGKHLGKSLIFLIRENGRRKHQLFLSSGQALRSAMEKRLAIRLSQNYQNPASFRLLRSSWRSDAFGSPIHRSKRLKRLVTTATLTEFPTSRHCVRHFKRPAPVNVKLCVATVALQSLQN